MVGDARPARKNTTYAGANEQAAAAAAAAAAVGIHSWREWPAIVGVYAEEPRA